MVDDFSDLEREFPYVVNSLRSGPLPNLDDRPSEQLWHSISSALAQEESGAAHFSNIDSPTTNSRPVLNSIPSPPPVVNEPVHITDDHASLHHGPGVLDELDSNVVDLEPRRLGRSMAIGFAAAAAVILVGLPLYLGLRGFSSSDLDGGVELAAIGSSSADAQAALAGRKLSVGIDDLEEAPDSSTYELWLLQVDGSGSPIGIEWIGTVDDASSVDQSFEVPAEIDTGLYTVVDISIEPDDGDLSHSGNSILRGDLTQR